MHIYICIFRAFGFGRIKGLINVRKKSTRIYNLPEKCLRIYNSPVRESTEPPTGMATRDCIDTYYESLTWDQKACVFIIEQFLESK